MESGVPLGLYILLGATPVLAVIAYFMFRKHSKSDPHPDRDILPGPYQSLDEIDPLCLYHFLPLLAQPNSRLFLLEVEPYIRAKLEAHIRPPRWLPSRCEILKDPLGWHIPVKEESLQVLRQLMGEVPLNGGDYCQLGWVIILYDDSGIYFEWINPPDEPVYVASRISDEAVQLFAQKARRQKRLPEYYD